LGAVPDLQPLLGPGGGVGGEGGVAPAVALLEQRQLGARMGTFPPDDDPHSGRPAAHLQELAQLGDLGTLADLAISVQGRRPRRARQSGYRAAFRLADRPPNQVLHPPPAAVLPGQPVQHRMGGGTVAADQQPAAVPGRDLAIASARISRWSAAVFAPALPGRSRMPSSSPPAPPLLGWP
jgi:hypothetical protein